MVDHHIRREQSRWRGPTGCFTTMTPSLSTSANDCFRFGSMPSTTRTTTILGVGADWTDGISPGLAGGNMSLQRVPCGVLKPFHSDPPASPPPLPPIQHGRVVLPPARVCHARLRNGAWDVLFEWHGLPADDATWEPLQSFVKRKPDFQLEVELFIEGGVMLWPSRLNRPSRARRQSQLCCSRITVGALEAWVSIVIVSVVNYFHRVCNRGIKYP